MVATGVTDKPAVARSAVETVMTLAPNAGWGEVIRTALPGERFTEAELSEWRNRAGFTYAGAPRGTVNTRGCRFIRWNSLRRPGKRRIRDAGHQRARLAGNGGAEPRRARQGNVG
jgi:hypothetical protein